METGLRSKLKDYSGSMKELSRRTGFTRQYVRMVLSGKAKNLFIMQEATTLLTELTAQERSIAEKLEQVVQEA